MQPFFGSTGTPFRVAVEPSMVVGSKEDKPSAPPFTKQTVPLPLSLLPLQSIFQVCGLASHAVRARLGRSEFDLFVALPGVMQSTCGCRSEWHTLVVVRVTPASLKAPVLLADSTLAQSVWPKMTWVNKISPDP